jgi:excisionase family DNA binding protein
MKKSYKGDTAMQREITQPLLITIEETMRMMRLGRTKIYALIRQEGLPVHRFGRRVLVDPDKLKSWLMLCENALVK